MGPYIRPTATDVTAAAARACPLFPNMVKTDGLFPTSDAADGPGRASSEPIFGESPLQPFLRAATDAIVQRSA